MSQSPHNYDEFCDLFTKCHLNMLGEGNGTLLQYSCLENPMDRGVWWAAVHGVAKSGTRLSNFTFTFTYWRRKWQPTPVFLPGESQGRQSLVGCRLWDRTESDMTEATQQHKCSSNLGSFFYSMINSKFPAFKTHNWNFGDCFNYNLMALFPL